jgi:hypothetical protein
MLRQAVLKEFDAVNHTAVIQPAGSHRAYMGCVRVAANIPPAEMTAGRRLVVAFLDPHDPRQAVVLGVYA